MDNDDWDDDWNEWRDTPTRIRKLERELRKLVAHMDDEEKAYMRRLCRTTLKLPTRVRQVNTMIRIVKTHISCKAACGNSETYWA